MNIRASLRGWFELLRWDKPSGRLILLIPAGWTLWLLPAAPPPPELVGLIVVGGLAVSGAGCVANDLWDRHIDPLVERTRERPLASGRVGVISAVILLLLCLSVALAVVLLLPAPGRSLSVLLALATLPPVLLYPSAKRWFPYPQLVLALCWGFAVLIPWAAATGSLAGGWPLVLAWLATLLWTFGFDTVYAMADRADDRAIGIRSSALTLGAAAPAAVGLCYGLAGTALGVAAGLRAVAWPFWPLWALAVLAMQREAVLLRGEPPRSRFGRHFGNQVRLGSLLLLALVLGRGA
jgi:4-hydroxybenzoate polyprenyltransferase